MWFREKTVLTGAVLPEEESKLCKSSEKDGIDGEDSGIRTQRDKTRPLLE